MPFFSLLYQVLTSQHAREDKKCSGALKGRPFGDDFSGVCARPVQGQPRVDVFETHLQRVCCILGGVDRNPRTPLTLSKVLQMTLMS